MRPFSNEIKPDELQVGGWFGWICFTSSRMEEG